ncbi:hypothetical protein [Planctomyces sp. SH-PL62]|uniref:hypothetical protein n=1 Tax=Planctomyces sp. SH-PL62 TaxID=1636152 RepID=UPI00078C04AB|nr:hypothetical protein [Planctomyces sp. SH-PL62]AMV37824.1 hypothetical protein VT85_10330 [Planctomyces sp. SH-PL62]
MSEELKMNVLRLLADATRLGTLKWRAIDPYENGFRSNVRGRTYEVRWLYWYDEDGFTIDRQCLSVLSKKWRCTSAWGTESMDSATRLLGEISPGMQEHFRRIATGLDPFGCDKWYEEAEDSPMPESGKPSALGLDALSLLLRLTRERKLQWERSQPPESHIYSASLGGRSFMIEMLSPALGEGNILEGLVARVSTGSGIICFVAGTPGMDFVHEILALCQPEWAERLETEREALEADRKFLLALTSA